MHDSKDPRQKFIEDTKLMLQSIIFRIVDDPKSIRIESHSGENTVLFRIIARGSTFGQIIGKSGKNVEAMRTLLYATAAKHQIRSVLEVDEP